MPFKMFTDKNKNRRFDDSNLAENLSKFKIYHRDMIDNQYSSMALIDKLFLKFVYVELNIHVDDDQFNFVTMTEVINC